MRGIVNLEYTGIFRVLPVLIFNKNIVDLYTFVDWLQVSSAHAPARLKAKRGSGGIHPLLPVGHDGLTHGQH